MASNSARNNGTQRIRFTKTNVDAINPPADRDRIYVYDEKVSGLAVCVMKTGRKTFYLYRKLNGKPVRVKLGQFPEMTVQQARDAATKEHANINNGINPNAKKRTARQQLTLGDLWGLFLDRYVGTLRIPTQREYKRQWKKDLMPWASRHLTDITVSDVEDLQRKIGASAPTMANRTVSLIRKLFNFAIDRQEVHFDGRNPASRIRGYREEARTRYLDETELPRLFKAIEEYPNPDWRQFFKLLLLTGVRRQNALSMEWDEIDFDRKQWNIPAGKWKTNRGHRVDLIDAALSILTDRKTDSESRWVFPSKRGNSGHMTSPQKAWETIRESAGLDDVRIHDCRRTFGAWLAKEGKSGTMVGKILGHAPGSPIPEKVYMPLADDTVRDASTSVSDAIFAAATINAQENANPHSDEK